MVLGRDPDRSWSVVADRSQRYIYIVIYAVQGNVIDVRERLPRRAPRTEDKQKTHKRYTEYITLEGERR